MATSGDTTFNVTRDQLINGALRIVGAIAQGETPTAQMVTDASEALNMIVKAWQADGMPLWVTKEYQLTPIAGQNTYTVTPKMLRVIQAWNRDSTSNVDIPMRVVTRDEYNRLGNKTSTGKPIQVYHNPNLADSTVKLYPNPDSNSATSNKIFLVYQKPFDDFDTSTDNPEFPSEYFDALKFALASRLSFEYGMEPNDRTQLMQQSTILKLEALSMGTEEGSMFFTADKRTW